MPIIAWDRSFSVGSASLDADHRKLVGMLNTIYDSWQAGADSAVLNKLFDDLLDYTDSHFAREEAKMLDCDWPGLPAHHAAHERLRNLVLAFRSRHLTGQAPDKLTEDMAQFLRSWLVDHILGDDLKYREIFKTG